MNRFRAHAHACASRLLFSFLARVTCTRRDVSSFYQRRFCYDNDAPWKNRPPLPLCIPARAPSLSSKYLNLRAKVTLRGYNVETFDELMRPPSSINFRSDPTVRLGKIDQSTDRWSVKDANCIRDRCQRLGFAFDSRLLAKIIVLRGYFYITIWVVRTEHGRTRGAGNTFAEKLPALDRNVVASFVAKSSFFSRRIRRDILSRVLYPPNRRYTRANSQRRFFNSAREYI